MSRTALILAGGKGTRLYPLTSVLPKPLLPIADKQIISYIIEDLYYCGIERFVIAIAKSQERLYKNYLGDDLEYSISPDEYNTAGRVKYAIENDGLEEDFILHYGDIISNVDYKSLIEYHKEQLPMATLLVKRGWKIPKGLVKSKDCIITEFEERYPLDEDVWTGIAVLNQSILQYLDEYSDLGSNTFPIAVESGEELRIFNFGGFFLDVGTQKEYDNAVKYLSEKNYKL